MNSGRSRVSMQLVVTFALAILGGGDVLAGTIEPADPAGRIEAQPAPAGKADEKPADALKPAEPYTTTKKLRLQIEGYQGLGLDSNKVGVTSSGDDVKISGGGGWGLGATLGYGSSKSFDIEGTLGAQASMLEPAVKNAHGRFTRSFLLATVKYKVPIRENLQWKFGLGAGYYMAGRLDIDVDPGIPGAADTVVDYGSSVGAHATGELEVLLQERLSLSAGLKVYRVTYKADRATVNGASVAVPVEYRNFKGDGVDVTVGLAVFF